MVLTLIDVDPIRSTGYGGVGRDDCVLLQFAKLLTTVCTQRIVDRKQQVKHRPIFC